MKIAITGGGTGGHLAIAKALNKALVQRGITTLYIGSTAGQDRQWFEKSEDFSATFFLPSQGVVNKRGFAKIEALGDIAKATKEIYPKIADVDGVVSVGGYSAAPASIAAILARKPLFIHEQNAVTGKLNKILSPFAARLFCSFQEPFDPYPVDESFFRLKHLRKKVKTVIFLGGSQGANQINTIALQLAPKIARRGIKIVHQTGKREFEKVCKSYEDMGIEADVFPFHLDIAQKIAQADIALSRAGATTLWELAANALPAFVVPYPHAAGNHQYFNANYFVKKGGALFYEKEEDFLEILDRDIEDMSRKMGSLASPDGARSIAEKIEEMLFTR